MNRIFCSLVPAMLLLVPACGKKKADPAPPQAGEKPVVKPEPGLRATDAVVHAAVGARRDLPLQVGKHSFSDADIDLRAKTIRFKYGNVSDIKVKACAQLVNGFLLVSVLEAMGKPITYAMLEEEVERIDRSTQAPEDLKKIKAIFEGVRGRGGDWANRYAMIFVLPEFANRKYFFDVFPKEKELQQPRLMEAQNVLSGLLKAENADFEKTAKDRSHWRRDEVLFHASRGFHPKPMPGEPPRPDTPDDSVLPRDDGSRWTRMEKELFKKTEKGKVMGQVIELDTAFLILRWTGFDEKQKTTRVVERLILEKLSPHDWFAEKMAEIHVSMADPALEKKFKEIISWAENLGWTKGN